MVLLIIKDCLHQMDIAEILAVDTPSAFVKGILLFDPFQIQKRFRGFRR